MAGVTVVDLTQVLAGPYATMLLGDQGARIIKVEPRAGDIARTLGSPPQDAPDAPFTGYFQSINRNKESIALDLKDPRGREALRRIIQGADIVVENFRAGVMEGLGLAYEELAALNPRLVYAAIRGFGDPRTGASPYVDWPSYDIVAQAMGGIVGVTGPTLGQPVKIGPSIGDVVPGLFAAVGILAALRHAERTGEGQFLDVGLYDAVLALSERIVHQFTYGGIVPGPEGNSHPLICPYGLFEARDGWVAIACLTEEAWRLLAEAMGTPALASDPRFATAPARLRHAALLIEAVTAWTRRHSKVELTAALGGSVPFGPVHTVADILADPHVTARQLIARLPHPGAPGRYGVVDTPIHLGRTPGGARAPAPLIGEHGRSILAGAGYDGNEVDGLIAGGVLTVPA